MRAKRNLLKWAFLDAFERFLRLFETHPKSSKSQPHNSSSQHRPRRPSGTAEARTALPPSFTYPFNVIPIVTSACDNLQELCRRRHRRRALTIL